MVKNMDDPRNMIYGIIIKLTFLIIDNAKSVVILTLPLTHSSPCYSTMYKSWISFKSRTPI
jgi:hypothetical protein